MNDIKEAFNEKDVTVNAMGLEVTTQKEQIAELNTTIQNQQNEFSEFKIQTEKKEKEAIEKRQEEK